MFCPFDNTCIILSASNKLSNRVVVAPPDGPVTKDWEVNYPLRNLNNVSFNMILPVQNILRSTINSVECVTAKVRERTVKMEKILLECLLTTDRLECLEHNLSNKKWVVEMKLVIFFTNFGFAQGWRSLHPHLNVVAVGRPATSSISSISAYVSTSIRCLTMQSFKQNLHFMKKWRQTKRCHMLALHNALPSKI